MQKEFDKQITQKLKAVSKNMEKIAEGWGSRLEDLSDEVDRLGSNIRTCEKSRRGNTKRIKKIVGSLGEFKDKQKKLREDHQNLVIRLAKSQKEQEKTTLLVKKLSRRKRKQSFENNTPPLPATRSVSPLAPQPAQMMQWSVSGQTPQQFVPRADTPRPKNVGQRQP